MAVPVAGGNGERGTLRTVLCTRGGLFGALVWQSLETCERIELCGVVRSTRWFQPSFGPLRGALAYIRRSGLAYACYLWCATTLTDALCALASTGRVPRRSRAQCVPVHTTRDINDREGLRFLSECAPDLLISAFFDQRLHEDALAVAALGSLNIHPSLLPSFRGVDPVVQARLRQTTPVGVTVHKMTPQLDAGRILAQQAVDVPDGASVFEATALLYRAGADLVETAIGGLEHESGNAPDDDAGTYQSWPSRSEIRALHSRGNVLIRLSDLRLAWR